jgi:hypothetical protein
MATRIDLILLAALLAGSLASGARAQIESGFGGGDRRDDPFGEYDSRTALDPRTGTDVVRMLKLPPAMPVKRPLELMPAKPVLTLKGEARSDVDLGRIEERRAEIVREIRAARDREDQRAVTDLVRELEQTRLSRLERLREIATPVAPEPEPDTRDETEPARESEAPVLPIPTLPEGKENG